MTAPPQDPMELPYDEFEAWLAGETPSESAGTTPLTRGTPVAWIEKRRGISVGVSRLHRAYEDGRTYCLTPIPPDDRRMPAPIHGVRVCEHCATLFRDKATLKEQVSYSIPRDSQPTTPSSTVPRSVMPHA